MPTHLFIVGANYRTATPGFRDRLASDEAEVPALLDQLRGHGLTQALWISTCDRIEVVAADTEPMRAADAIIQVFAQRVGAPEPDLASQTYTLFGPAATRHLFSVACSLDSQVIGEPHVLGQIKAAHRLAASAGLSGSDMEAALQAAYAAAKRVRNETALAKRPTSIAAAAVQVARDIHGDLSQCSALVVGLADIGLLLAEQFRDAGLARFSVTAPSDRRAEAAARRMAAHWTPFSELESAVVAADIVITATGSGRYILDRALIDAASRRRRRRPMFLIDGGVPADVDPAVATLDGIFVYDLDDLERLALEGRASREAAAAGAWTIVDDAVAEFSRSRAERAAIPAIAALRHHFEMARLQLLAEHDHLDGAAATRLLINRLLHEPSERLRRRAADGAMTTEQEAMEQLLRRLFALNDGHKGDQDS
ncbi:MAG: glutamyl-tRNA reductase [Azospirillaceae bacterium]|nr:glutamyl-tRNA reductase [Azospirillaceae bacterium]